MTTVLVIIPTYNESANIDAIVARVRANQPQVNILIVDDNSPDGTGLIADALAGDPRIDVLHRVQKDGLGAAYLAGFDYGLAQGFDVLVEMDADGSHRPEQLGLLLDQLETGADLVIGSRWVPGGAVVNWPRRRKFLSRAGNAYARLMLRLDQHDATAGYRAFRRETLEKINLDGVQSQGYCFQVDLTRRTVAAGLEVREVPITFIERVRGESKMSGSIVREAMWRVTVWGIAARLRRGR